MSIVLDRDDSTLAHDRRWLFEELRRSTLTPQLSYVHRHRHEEPLPVMPDAVAWCWQRGGEWRRRVKNIIAEVHDL
ncbi:hypothetical protein [Cellulomonas hominis]